MRIPRFMLAAAALAAATVSAQPLNILWSGYAHDPQHTAVSPVASQALNAKHWQTQVDLNPLSSRSLLIHYGSISVTAENTVLVPVRTTSSGGFGYQVMAFNGVTGAPLYTLATDYTPPPHDWIPPYGPVISLGDRLYYPGAGGTVYFRDLLNSMNAEIGQLVFYGSSTYAANQAAFNSAVKISTPITADHNGNIYFGFIATANPANLISGIARIGRTGVGTWVSAASLAANDPNVQQVALNCAPALSNDQRTLYVAVAGGSEFDNGYLVSLDAGTLAPIAHVPLVDPSNGQPATISSDSSASPMVAPDGDVYYGVLETPCCESHNDRGWMLHFDATLSKTKIPGSFGWDDTPSLVPARSVPAYRGTSSYLILTKYNNYVGAGTGDGINKIAILDPNAAMQDEYSTASVQVMQEVITVTSVSPGGNPRFPNALKEWCINTAVIDPATKSAIVNNEDGRVYRWDFTTNTLSAPLVLTAGIGEAYTPTVIGPDGTIYAINDGILFAVGK